MQAKCKFDDVGDALVGHASALLIFERLGVAPSRQEALPKVVSTNDAEVLRVDRLAVPFHRRQQLSDAGAVDLIDAEELRQRLVRATDLGEDFALHGGAGKPAETRQ